MPRIPNTVPREFSEIVFSIEHATDEEPPRHVCGKCRTPWGRSAITCPNEEKV